VEVTLLLCDWAEVVNGKLYIMGAGWSRVLITQPVTVAVAILIKVPWAQTNQRHTLKFTIANEDGQPLTQETPDGTNEPVIAGGEFEIGRPPGTTPGTDFDTPVAFKLGPLVLTSGRYVCELEIDGTVEAKATFEGVGGFMPNMGGPIQ